MQIPMRIRIGFNADSETDPDPDTAFLVNADPDPDPDLDPGFWYQKLGKIYSWKKKYLQLKKKYFVFDQKLQFT